MIRLFTEAGGKWIDLDQYYESYDGSHLAEADAIKLSNELAQKIANGNVDVELDQTKNYRHHYLPDEKMISHIKSDSMLTLLNIKTPNNTNGILTINKDKNHFNLHIENSDFLINNHISKIYIKLDVLINKNNEATYLEWLINRNSENLHYQSLDLSMILKEEKWGAVIYHINVPADIQKNDEIKLRIYNLQNAIQLKHIELFYF